MWHVTEVINVASFPCDRLSRSISHAAWEQVDSEVRPTSDPRFCVCEPHGECSELDLADEDSTSPPPKNKPGTHIEWSLESQYIRTHRLYCPRWHLTWVLQWDSTAIHEICFRFWILKSVWALSFLEHHPFLKFPNSSKSDKSDTWPLTTKYWAFLQNVENRRKPRIKC